jgi:hypothetical protein
MCSCVQRLLRDFSSSVENYDIVPETERTLHQRKASAIRDPKKKREIKIMQYKKEKELRAKLEVSAEGIHTPSEPSPTPVLGYP